MKPSLKIEAITAAACDADLIAIRREVIQRLGYKLRPGEGNRIEIRSHTPVEYLSEHDTLRFNPWSPMMLPQGAVSFITAQERDAVLSQLLSP